ncbi:Gfo/Idh/MocA family protein [Phytohabitans rumicis]|uniref:Dehydrogenase n=1 Tax=Phytohabitans rumicis TaxID=1076125 RepID=A0A6V8KWU2_9ACTN|nr:Gfo/Idh/MocA family oxidoreductase [Phytohabitans rumicis]GFJ86759.1 dehydrogenase [Phytohabitans rumicis]
MKPALRMAIVGFGTAGEARLSAYRPIAGADVVAVVETSPQRRERVRALDPEVRVHASLDELWDATPVDAVDICTPPAYHGELARLALAAGRHVICEKPVAFSTEDALDLVAHARRGGALLYPAHNYGFSPMMRVLADAVARGRVGSPMSGTFEIQRDTHARGVAGWLPDWRRDPALAGGGIMMDHGTHCVYMATRLFAAVPAKVTASARWAGGDPSGGVDEAIDVRLDFPTGDCTIGLSWVAARRTNRYELSGPQGTASVRDGVAELTGAGGPTREALASPTGTPHTGTGSPACSPTSPGSCRPVRAGSAR